MPDCIALLPDHIANQIAAGEVIQRPASAVKELLENAVDAGATEIKLIITDAGKSLIQVIDNGTGMSETDARMSFERHATSKIQTIDDLFQIRTMGFRGEALASIAAVAQVELKTKKADNTTGIFIEVENSVVKKQEVIAAPTGTSIAMKNLFFNVPARRNFLKSNAAEMRHIIDEFTRVSLAFPNIFFSLFSNNQPVFHLEPGNLKQRILQLLGNNYNTKLVSVKEETDYMNIYGFVGKPDTAKKTRGDQYFLVNNRFIKSPYLNHAVTSAFREMIAKDSFPTYVLCIDLDPAHVDINVHPTKQEIKFEDEKIIYAFVQAAVKHSLAQFSVAPALDFDLDAAIQQLPSIQQPFTEKQQATTQSGSIFKGFTEKHQAHFIEPSKKNELKPWKDLYELSKLNTEKPIENLSLEFLNNNTDEKIIQLHQQFILVATSTGFILVQQQLAHERIIYEQLQNSLKGKNIPTQKSLFPITLTVSAADAILLEELSGDLLQFGYCVEPFGKNSFVLQGTPADVEQGNEKQVFDSLLEQFKHFSSELNFSKREKLIRSLAKQQATKTGKQLTETEMQFLIKNLFDCKLPNISPDGAPTYLEFKKDQLEKMFGK